MVWSLSTTRAISSCKTFAVHRNVALAAIQDPPTLLSLSPLVASKRLDATDSDATLYHVTDCVQHMGISTATSYTAKFTNVEDGADIEMRALWEAMHSRNKWRVLPGKTEDECEVHGEVVVQAFFLFMPFALHAIRKSHQELLETLAATLEGRPRPTASGSRLDDDYSRLLRRAVWCIVAGTLLSRIFRPGGLLSYPDVAFLLLFLGFLLKEKAQDPYGSFHISLNARPDNGDDSAPKTEWLNMGYWAHTSVFPEACEALAMQLVQAARLQPDANVLDVGHGSGESLCFLLSHPDIPRPSKLTGITSLKEHHERSLERVNLLKTDIPVELYCGDAVHRSRAASATAHPLNPESATPPYDTILALDCAYHFRTREDFLRQSFARLAPGGRIGMADMCFSRAAYQNRRRMFLLSLMGLMPRANMISMEKYVLNLREMGFEDVELQDVSAEVYPGFAQFLQSRGGGWSVFSRVIRWYYAVGARFVIVTARKPMVYSNGN